MTATKLELPPPTDFAVFETWCSWILPHHLGVKKLQGWGTAGDKQFGIDLFGERDDLQRTRVGVQCKLRRNGLTVKELKSAIAEAEGFPELRLLCIATSARRNSKLQNELLQINTGRRESGKLEVMLHAWDDFLRDFLERPDLKRKCYPDLVSDHEPSILQLGDRVASYLPILAGTNGDEHPIDRTITQAFKDHIDTGRPEKAIAIYEQIQTNHWNSLTPHQRYRLMANWGHALLKQDDYAGAAKKYHAAAEQEEGDNSKILRARAYWLQDNRIEAHAVAQALCNARPDFADAHWVRLHCLSGNPSFDDVLAGVPESVKADPQVAIALSWLAKSQDLGELAIHWARQAVAAKPDWDEALHHLASLLLESQREEVDWTSEPEPQFAVANPSAVREALALLDQILSREEILSVHFRAQAYYSRSTARRLLDGAAAGRTDLQRAHELQPKEGRIAGTWATDLHSRKNGDEAIRVLDALPLSERHLQGDVMLAVWLGERNRDGDIAHAVSVLEAWKGKHECKDFTASFEWAKILIQCRLTVEKTTDALVVADSVVTDLPIDRGNAILRAMALDTREDNERLRPFLDEALRSSSADSTWPERYELCRLLNRHERHAEALSVIQPIARPKLLTPEVRLALEAAEAAEDWAYVLQTCSTLRSNGVWDRATVREEVKALMRIHEWEEATTLLERWLERRPDDYSARVQLGHLALQRGREDLAVQCRESIPDTWEASPALGEQWARLYLFGSNPDAERAGKIAYQL